MKLVFRRQRLCLFYSLHEHAGKVGRVQLTQWSLLSCFKLNEVFNFLECNTSTQAMKNVARNWWSAFKRPISLDRTKLVSSTLQKLLVSLRLCEGLKGSWTDVCNTSFLLEDLLIPLHANDVFGVRGYQAYGCQNSMRYLHFQGQPWRRNFTEPPDKVTEEL